MTTSATKRSLGNLPADLTSFVGRQREVADIRQALTSSRLVTLVGAGGVGKTRLGLRAAGEVSRAFPDGVWFVDIAPVREDDLLAPTIAEALDLQSRSQRWAPSVLSRHLSGRNLLLLLDNCEHLAHSCAVIVDALLRTCPQLRVLATSRQSLDIGGEHIVVVQPLPVPAADAVLKPEALVQYDAVSLFTERARAIAPAFHVTAENHVAVAQLCRRLDGIPLALELAAARLRLLSPQQILDRLDAHHGILATGSRVAAPRQRSLRSLIDWSYDLCTPEERTLWARLTVFPSGFSVEAVEEICGGDNLPRESLLDALAGLVDKSIVSVEHRGGGVRYRMLETIRMYGHERLAASGQEASLRLRHRDHFARVMADWFADWFGPGQVERLAWMRAERDNLRTAIEFCLSEQDDSNKAVLLASAIGGQTFAHGFLDEGRRWMERVLATFDAPSAEHARLLWVDGWHALNQGDTAGGVLRFEASREMAERTGAVPEAAMATVFLGVAEMMRGQVEAAARLYETALARLRGMDAPLGSAVAAYRLGAALFLLGDADRAVALCEEAIELSEAHGELWHRAEALWELSIITWQQAELGRAAELAMESLRIQRSFGHAVGTAQCLETLAWIAASGDAYERAGRLLGAADALWRAIDASLFSHMAGHHDRCEKETRRALGDRSFSAAHQHGAHASVSDNVAYALGEEAEQADSVRDRTADVRLTHRELEIADLVAQGLSNREIAAKLVISQRTAEGHVEHILTKLGFASRAQIAAWAAERRAASTER
jgi:predicted ATPase/DNA-binding CsgD family transcriptional regulator